MIFSQKDFGTFFKKALRSAKGTKAVITSLTVFQAAGFCASC
jgi:hypothetical protein